MVVFTAATGDQTAFPYIEKHHGMFTYFLLKKLQETSGEATLSEIGNYISEQVSQQVAIQKGRKQTPLTIPSATYSGNWKETKLKQNDDIFSIELVKIQIIPQRGMNSFKKFPQ